MAHRQGVYFAPTHGRNEDWQYIKSLQPPVIRILDPDVSEIDRLLSAAPAAEIWFRNWVLDDDNQKRHQEMIADPERSAQRHANDWFAYLTRLENEARSRGFRFPPRDRLRIGSINEPNTYEFGPQIFDYTASWLEACTAEGVPSAALNFPVGHPGLPEYSDPYTWEYFADLAPFFGDLHVINVHEYCRKDGPHYGEDWGNLMGRHARAKNTALAQVPWYVGEWGVEGHIYGEYPAGTGWRYHEFDISAEQYARWMVDYSSQCEPYIKALCPFLLDYANNQWATLDISPAIPQFLSVAPKMPVPDQPPPSPPDRTLVWPVEGKMTQQFNENPQNYPRHPGHMGLDIGAPHGREVKCLANGTVTWSDWDNGYGNYVRVWHPHLRVHTFYAHLSERKMTKGDTVTAGQVVGLVGSTGNSTGPHLHWEVRLATDNGGYEDPGNGHANGRVDPLTAWHIWQRG